MRAREPSGLSASITQSCASPSSAAIPRMRRATPSPARSSPWMTPTTRPTRSASAGPKRRATIARPCTDRPITRDSAAPDAARWESPAALRLPRLRFAHPRFAFPFAPFRRLHFRLRAGFCAAPEPVPPPAGGRRRRALDGPLEGAEIAGGSPRDAALIRGKAARRGPVERRAAGIEAAGGCRTAVVGEGGEVGIDAAEAPRPQPAAAGALQVGGGALGERLVLVAVRGEGAREVVREHDAAEDGARLRAETSRADAAGVLGGAVAGDRREADLQVPERVDAAHESSEVAADGRVLDARLPGGVDAAHREVGAEAVARDGALLDRDRACALLLADQAAADVVHDRAAPQRRGTGGPDGARVAGLAAADRAVLDQDAARGLAVDRPRDRRAVALEQRVAHGQGPAARAGPSDRPRRVGEPRPRRASTGEAEALDPQIAGPFDVEYPVRQRAVDRGAGAGGGGDERDARRPRVEVEVAALVQVLARPGERQRVGGPCGQPDHVLRSVLPGRATTHGGVVAGGAHRLAQRAARARIGHLVRRRGQVDRRGDGLDGCGERAREGERRQRRAHHSARCSPAFRRRSRSSRSSSGVGSNCAGSGSWSRPERPKSFSNRVVVA